MVDSGLLLQFQVFLLVLARVFGMLVLTPFFSSLVIPFRVRALLAFFVALIMVTLALGAAAGAIKPELSVLPFILQLVGELFVGMTIGFIVAVYFAAFSFAAELFSVQMGLSITMVFDPQAQIEVPVIGQLFSLFAVLVFIGVGAHHHVLNGIWSTYTSLPVLEISRASGPFAQGVAAAFVAMFSAALKIALPIISVAFLISLSMGILGKTAPQLNLLMLGFPIQILVGLTVMLACLPFIFRFMGAVISQSVQFAMRVMGVTA